MAFAIKDNLISDMTLWKKIEVGCGVAAALLGIFIYVDILLQDIAMSNRLNNPLKFSSDYLLAFLILTLPCITIAIGSYAHAIRRKSWGLGLMLVGGVVNNLLIIIYAVGIAYALNNNVRGAIAVFVEFTLVIISLIAACVSHAPSNNSFNRSAS